MWPGLSSDAVLRIEGASDRLVINLKKAARSVAKLHFRTSVFVEMTVERTGHVHRATVNMVNEGLDTLQIFQLGCSTREPPRLSSIPRGVH